MVCGSPELHIYSGPPRYKSCSGVGLVGSGRNHVLFPLGRKCFCVPHRKKLTKTKAVLVPLI